MNSCKSHLWGETRSLTLRMKRIKGYWAGFKTFQTLKKLCYYHFGTSNWNLFINLIWSRHQNIKTSKHQNKNWQVLKYINYKFLELYKLATKLIIIHQNFALFVLRNLRYTIHNTHSLNNSFRPQLKDIWINIG